MPLKNRLLITGAPGAGKSSAVRSLSDIPPKVSNIYENAPHLAPDGLGSVMLDYGELFIDEDHKLELYATPGQRRFQFMWKALAAHAMGLIVLVDNRRPNPIGDMRLYLDNFNELVDAGAAAVGVNYYHAPGGPTLEQYQASFTSRGAAPIPVIAIDPRSKADSLYLLSSLLARPKPR
jgi:signal recognition particle receptor subunit beta